MCVNMGSTPIVSFFSNRAKKKEHSLELIWSCLGENFVLKGTRFLDADCRQVTNEELACLNFLLLISLLLGSKRETKDTWERRNSLQHSVQTTRRFLSYHRSLRSFCLDLFGPFKSRFSCDIQQESALCLYRALVTLWEKYFKSIFSAAALLMIDDVARKRFKDVLSGLRGWSAKSGFSTPSRSSMPL